MGNKRINVIEKSSNMLSGVKYRRVVIGIAILTLLFIINDCSGAHVFSLYVECEEASLGIVVVQPRFNWQMESHKQGQSQRAYQVVIMTQETIAELWNSDRVLSDLRHFDAAYRILQQTSYPSRLYFVEQWGTTIWEWLNSYIMKQCFSGYNSMISFNYYPFGAIGSWMLNQSLSIVHDESYAGFKHFVQQPEPKPTGEMTWAKGNYDSTHGRIEGEWQLNYGKCNYSFNVPAISITSLCLEYRSIEKEIVMPCRKNINSA